MEYTEDELIELLGLTRWYKQTKLSYYPLYEDERKELHGKPIEYLQIKPDVDYEKGDIVLLSAPLGTGKSYGFKKKLKGTTCLITPRKSITRAWVNELANIGVHYVYYIDPEKSGWGIRSTEELLEAVNLAMVGLSTQRLITDKPMKKFNNVILEEFEANQQQNVSNQSSNPQDTNDSINSLIERADKVFCLGWLFRDNNIEFLEKFTGEGKSKRLIFDFWHKDIAKELQLNIYHDEDKFFENVNDVASSQRVLLFTDRAKGCKTIAERIDATTDYFYSDKLPTKEQEEAYADTEMQGMTNQVEIFSPIVSHGYNFRNETPRTMMYLANTTWGSKLTMTDVVQFMFRNRDQKIIDLFIHQTKDENILNDLNAIATREAQFTSDKIRTFGTYCPIQHKKIINPDLEIVKQKRCSDNIALIEKASCLRTLLLYLGWLGLPEDNVNHIREVGSIKKSVTRNSSEDIVNHGRFLRSDEYALGNNIEQTYTDICKDLGVQELTLKDIAYYDNGNFRENEIRNKQLSDDYFVKNAHNKSKGLFEANARFGAYQYYLWNYMKDKDYITNLDFRYSEFWSKVIDNEYIFNQTMRNENLPELCVTVDDKQCPLKWLKRYLTKHNFYCEIYRPSKERKSELTKNAQKSCAKDYNKWKAWQLTLPKEERYRGLQNFRITHYLGWLVQNEKHKDMTDEMRALRLVYDEWNMSIESYETDNGFRRN